MLTPDCGVAAPPVQANSPGIYHGRQSGYRGDPSQGARAPTPPYQSSTGSGNRSRQVDVRQAASSAPKYCHAFQRGSCTRDACPFLHEKEVKTKPADKTRKKPGGKPAGAVPKTQKGGGKTKSKSNTKKKKECYKCGSEAHLAPDCSFEGKCDYCGKAGHKQAVCKKKASEAPRAAVATEVAVRVSSAERDWSPRSTHDVWPEEWATPEAPCTSN